MTLFTANGFPFVAHGSILTILTRCLLPRLITAVTELADDLYYNCPPGICICRPPNPENWRVRRNMSTLGFRDLGALIQVNEYSMFDEIDDSLRIEHGG